MSRYSVLDWARYYVSLGLSVIPIAYRSKKPSIPWEEFQSRKPTEDELQAWFGIEKANIAVVTGDLSGLVVIDVDEEAGYRALQGLVDMDAGGPRVKTPKGQHLWFAHPLDGRAYPNNTRKFTGCDFRGDGGYVIVPPSLNEEGQQYTWAVHPKDAPLSVLPFGYISKMFNVGVGNNHPYSKIINCTTRASHDERDATLQSVTERDISFANGSRDDSLFSVANSLLKGGMSAENVYKVLETLANSWGESSEDQKIKRWLEDKVGSAVKRLESRGQSLADSIREWVRDTSGTWNVTDCDRDIGIVTIRDKANRRTIFSRLVADGIIERDPGRARVYRRVQSDLVRIDWAAADTSMVYPVRWPFALERWVTMYPKNIAVVAGASNAGKSAFMYNVARLNMHSLPVRFISSEVGPEELKLRLSKFEIPMSEWEQVEFIDRSSNFAHVIAPDALNIIDYMEMSGDSAFYSVGGWIREVWERLNKGIAAIAIQKKKDTKNAQYDRGRGAEFSEEKSRLYLSIDDGRLKIVKGKNWARQGVNPNGKVIRFRLVSGCNFIEEEEKED